jgi:two-component system, LytTR family, sensor kinase
MRPVFGLSQRLWLPILGLATLWTAIYMILLQELFQLSWEDSLLESLGFNSILGVVAFISVTALRFYNPSTDRFIYLILVAGIITAVAVAIDTYLLNLLFDKTFPIDYSERVIYFNSGFGFLILLSIQALGMQRNMLAEESELQQRKEETERIAKEAELDKLRHQLQPHFLFNSLNSINALILSQPAQARRMVQQLSAFLRGTIRADDSKVIPLKEEMEHINLYLEIEKVRFGHRLQTEMLIGAACESMFVPPLLLQPLLENAIKFGLYGTTGDVLITLGVECVGGFLAVSISNPTDNESTSQSGTGFGLTSIKRRLNLLFGRNDLLYTTKTDDLFTVNLKIPQKHD